MNRLQLKATVQSNPVALLYREYVVDSIMILRKDGVRGLVRERGWKFLALIIGYYVVRDSLIYIVIPYCLAQGIF
jgi:hypothetical protein